MCLHEHARCVHFLNFSATPPAKEYNKKPSPTFWECDVMNQLYGEIGLRDEANRAFQEVEETECWKRSGRIQRGLEPLSYDVEIIPLMLERFSGKAIIEVRVRDATISFAVHCRNLQVTRVVFSDKGNNAVTLKSSFWYEPHQFWVIEMYHPIAPGIYQLTYEFTGSFADVLHGLYTDDDTLGYTILPNFMPTNARQVFPCFDEPQIKCKFRFTVLHLPDHVTVLSNGKPKRLTPTGDGEYEICFEETPMIPLPFLGIVAANVEKMHGFDVKHDSAVIPVTMYTSCSNIRFSSYIEDVLTKLIDFCSKYFGLPFPVEKLDIITLPGLPGPPVSCWGLLIFRDVVLLYLESIQDLRRMIRQLSRGIATQWLGCLVTPKWWNDMWLIEAFASFVYYTYFQHEDDADPKFVEQVSTQMISEAMEEDSAYFVDSLDEAFADLESKEDVLDFSHCKKGFGIFRMVEDLIGDQNFRKGVQDFMESHRNSTATSANLWKCFDKFDFDSDMPLSDIMPSWICNVGYPIIRVCRRGRTWRLTQNPCLRDRNVSYNSNSFPLGYKWDIPVRYISSHCRKDKLIWFKSKDEMVEVTIDETLILYVKFNHKGCGYYRVNYEICLWKRFAEALKKRPECLNSVDRANLLDDVFSLAEGGHTDYESAIAFFKYIGMERDYAPWSVMHKWIKRLSKRLVNTQYFHLFMKTVRKSVENIYGSDETQLNWEAKSSDSKSVRCLRYLVLDLACLSKVPACLEEVRAKFVAYLNTGDLMVHPDLHGLVLKHGVAATGLDEYWEQLWKIFLDESDPRKRLLLLNSLANYREKWALIKLLENVENMKSLEYLELIKYMTENPFGQEVLWEFFATEWENLIKRFHNHRGVLKKVAVNATREYHDSFVLETVRRIMERAQRKDQTVWMEIVKNVEFSENWVNRNRKHFGQLLDGV